MERRFNEHKEGKIKGAKYTKTHKPLGVEAVWQAEDKSSAAKLEYRIKQLDKSEKEDLILNNKDILALKEKDCEYIFKRLC